MTSNPMGNDDNSRIGHANLVCEQRDEDETEEESDLHVPWDDGVKKK